MSGWPEGCDGLYHCWCKVCKKEFKTDEFERTDICEPCEEATMTPLEKKTIAILVEHDGYDYGIKLEDSLKDDLFFDSLDLIEILMAFEDQFQIDVDDEEVEHIKTVNDIVMFLRGKGVEDGDQDSV